MKSQRRSPPSNATVALLYTHQKIPVTSCVTSRLSLPHRRLGDMSFVLLSLY